MELIQIKFSSEFLLDAVDPEDLFTHITGEILDVEHDEAGVLLGRFTLKMVDVDICYKIDYGAEYLFDASDSTLRIYESLFDASGDLKESVVQRIGEDADLTRFMILDRIEILPDYRGRALGAKVVLHLMERFAGDRGVVVVEPFPIQAESAPEAAPFGSAWREMMGLDSLQPDEKKASASLRKFYSKVGFVPLPGSRFMVRKIA